MENTSREPPRLFTVGHSNNDEAGFLGLLRGAGITALADVRSSPYSRRHPHFNKPALAALARRNGIAYVFLGDHLGGRPADDKLYDPTERGFVVNYERVRATPLFQKGLDRLQAGLDHYTIALMCGEEDPLPCHRGLMITPALVERGIAPLHLRKGGVIETTAQMEVRLLTEVKMAEGVLDGLFPPSPEEYRQLLDRAYRLLNARVAFRLETEGE